MYSSSVKLFSLLSLSTQFVDLVADAYLARNKDSIDGLPHGWAVSHTIWSGLVLELGLGRTVRI